MVTAPLKPFLTLDAIKKRVESGSTLIIAFDKVYDLTNWKYYHPGGNLILKHFNGQDSTDQMIAFHPEWVWETKMPLFCIARLHPKDIKVSKISLEYRRLEKKLKDLGLFKTNYLFFALELLKFAFLWSCLVYLVCFHNSNFGYFVSASCAGLLWHQAAFFAHDGGLSLGWWKKSHNVHHVVTNDPENDPDIQHLPFFAVSTRFVQNLYSTYYNRIMKFDALAKTLVPLQHYTFYLILAFGRFNLYFLGWNHVFYETEYYFMRNLELVGMSVFVAWFSYVLSFLPSTGHIIAYILWSHWITTILHCQITLSHFGMDTNVIENETFAEKAFRTTMDIDCPQYMDWFHGGLQYQIEHHLYPRIPRHNLRIVQKYVKEFAKRNNIQMHSYTFIKGNRYLLGVLQDIANQIQAILNPTTECIDSE